MTKLLLALLAALLAAPCAAEQPLVGATRAVRRSAVVSGAGAASGSGLSLRLSVGQSAASALSGAGLKVDSGFAPLSAQPGTVTSIVAVSKSTGDLTLSWTAPGLDGALGAGTAGYYRIDSSSDPLHVFDPTVFLTEFSTTVAPGDPQSYTLTGLLPNTTYYTRIYLADARKMVAETSTAGEIPTLANIPATPSIAGVFESSVSFSWTLPAGGAAGFQIDSSSTNFGALFPGGVVVSSVGRSGVIVTMTVQGLRPDTSYFFKVASLSWSDDKNFTTILTTRTLPSTVAPVENLAIARDAAGHRVVLSWTNPSFPDQAGVLVIASTNPIAASPAQETPYAAGFAFGDGSVVRSAAADASHVEAGLALDTTQYFALYSKNLSHRYSVVVTTSVVLDLPPMAPAALSAARSADGSSVTLSWSNVASSSDGSWFKNPSAPDGWELESFEVYRATGIARPTWVLVGTAAASATTFVSALPVPAQAYFFRVDSKDRFPGGGTDSGMVVDSAGGLYVVAPDQVTRLKIPASAASLLKASGNSFGAPLVIRPTERPEDLAGRVLKSVSFDAVQSPSGVPARLALSEPDFDVVLGYDVAGGVIVPSGAGAQAGPLVDAGDAAGQLAMYWNNGQEFVNLHGRVDPADQTVALRSSMLGGYQIRSVVRADAFAFDLAGVSNRALSPNGDGLNDTVIFTLENPRDSAVSGKVYDLRGRFVSDMRRGPVENSLLWDGKSGGNAVPRGVYIYAIRAEGKTFRGTVVVTR